MNAKALPIKGGYRGPLTRATSTDLDRFLRSRFGRDLVENSSRFGREMVEIWSNFGRDLVEIWFRFGRGSVKIGQKCR